MANWQDHKSVQNYDAACWLPFNSLGNTAALVLRLITYPLFIMSAVVVWLIYRIDFEPRP